MTNRNIFRDIVYCETCQRTGKIAMHFNEVLCVECMGIGHFTIEHLRQVRAGRSIKRLRQRYFLRVRDMSRLFGLQINEWKRIEYGHFSIEYTLDVFHIVKRYTDTLEKLPFYTLMRNPSSRRKRHKELMTSFNKVLIDREIEKQALTPKECQVITQYVYVEKLS